MFRRTRIACGLAALVLTGTLTPVGTATAHEFTRTDGNDSRSLWDLRSVSVKHKRDDLIYTFKTFESWKANSLLGDAQFLIALDAQGDGTPNRCLFIYYSGGGLKGAVTDCGRKLLSGARVSKPSPRQARIVYAQGVLRGSHYWYAGSYWKGAHCKRGCLDFAPNKTWLLHDLVDPTTAWITPTTGLTTSLLSTSLTVPLSFTASDSESGVASWELLDETGQARDVETWSVLASGDGGGTIEMELDVAEGDAYMLKAFATDLQGNVGGREGWSDEILYLVVPYDDGNVGMTYSGTWATVADPAHFLGSTHTAVAGATVSFTVTSVDGMTVRVVGGPANASAQLTVGTESATVSEEVDDAKGGIAGFASLSIPAGTQTVSLEVLSGTFVFDGFAVFDLF